MWIFQNLFQVQKHRSKYYKIYTQPSKTKKASIYTVTPHCPQGMVTAWPWISKSSNVQVPYVNKDNENLGLYISTTEKHKEKILKIVRGKMDKFLTHTHTHTHKKGQNYNTPSHQKLRKPVENGVTTKKILK